MSTLWTTQSANNVQNAQHETFFSQHLMQKTDYRRQLISCERRSRIVNSNVINNATVSYADRPHPGYDRWITAPTVLWRCNVPIDRYGCWAWALITVERADIAHYIRLNEWQCASISLWLSGDGKPGLKALTGQELNWFLNVHLWGQISNISMK